MKMAKVKFTFYIPESLADKLERLIALYRLKKKKKLTKSYIVEEALKKELGRLEEELKGL